MSQERRSIPLYVDTSRPNNNEHYSWYVEFSSENLREKFKQETNSKMKELEDDKFRRHFVYDLSLDITVNKGIGQGKGLRKKNKKTKDKDRLIDFIKNLDETVLVRFLLAEKPADFYDFKIFTRKRSASDDLIYLINLRDWQEIKEAVNKNLCETKSA